MRTLVLTLGMAAALGLLVQAAGGRADEEKVPLNKLPRAVEAAVKARFPGAKLVHAGKEMDEDQTVYEVGIQDKGHGIEVTLTSDGKVVEIEKELAAKDLPRAVTEALEGNYPRATYQKVEEVIKPKDGAEKTEYYEVLLVAAGGKKWEVSVAPNGKVVKEEDKSNEKDEDK